MGADSTTTPLAPAAPAGAIYRGVVSHKRWKPVGHGFAYELFMLLVDCDRLDEVFAGCPWPIAALNSRAALVSLAEGDHMKLSRRPGQRLGDAVRDAVHAATGWRPSAACRVQMLTMPAVAGYSFNPVSFYYVWDERGAAVDTVIAEVTNTPWNEMHYYVCRSGAPGVTALPAWETSAPAAPAAPAAGPAPPAARPGGGKRARARSSSSSSTGSKAVAARRGSAATAGAAAAAAAAAERPTCVETPGDAKQLASAGAVHPADFDALADRFDKAPEAPPARPEGTTPAGRRLRFKFAKSFHVSPFMSLSDQEYDWIFTEPGHDLGSPSGTILVQNQNLRRVGEEGSEGRERMFNSQLRLVKQPLTPWALVYLVMAFPLLTLRVQWWIHVEAVKLWWKGVELYAHPTGATNGFVRTVELLFTPLVWLAMLVSRVGGLLRPVKASPRGGLKA